jgi:hypothetical protein
MLASPQAYRNRVAQMIAEIEEAAAAERKRTGKSPIGVQAILAQEPWTRPETCRKSPAPFVHAVSRESASSSEKATLGSWRSTARQPSDSGREIPPRLPDGMLPAGVAVCRVSAFYVADVRDRPP